MRELALQMGVTAHQRGSVSQNSVLRVPTVNVRGGSAIRRPLIILAVCAVGVVAHLARDFPIPTAAAIFLALILTPVAKRFARLRMPPTTAAGASVALLARVMRDINDRVDTYLFALVVIYSLVAVVSTIVLALMGFPNPILWGVLVGLASFVLFIGPPVAIGLVAFVTLLTYDDWMHMLAAPAVLAAIHFVESQLVTPAFVSRRCALNTVAVFVGVAFLGWMWGAVGAIVAVPLLILISTIAAHLPSLRWLEVLLSEDRPVSERLAVKPPLASATPVHVRRRRLATK